MSSGAFELLALSARYVFAGLMLLIAVRAAAGAAQDSKRAAELRRLSPQTGQIGELIVMYVGEADRRVRPGMRFPVIREGMIGSSRRADVRIRHRSVRARHGYFQMTDAGLKVRSHAGARLRDRSGRPVREIVLTDGGKFTVGGIKLMLVLAEGGAGTDSKMFRFAEDELPRRGRARTSSSDFEEKHAPKRSRAEDDVKPFVKKSKPETGGFFKVSEKDDASRPVESGIDGLFGGDFDDGKRR